MSDLIIVTRHVPATDREPARVRARAGGRSFLEPRDEHSPDPHAHAAAALASILAGRTIDADQLAPAGAVTRGYRFRVIV